MKKTSSLFFFIMIIIKLTIKPASPDATKLFMCGNATFPERFSYATEHEHTRIIRSLHKFDAGAFHALFNRNDLDGLKEDVLLGRHSAHSRALWSELANVSMVIRFFGWFLNRFFRSNAFCFGW